MRRSPYVKKPPSSDWTAVSFVMGEKYYAVFLPRRSAIASTSSRGNAVL